MTQAQKKAISRLWERSHDGTKDFDEFAARFGPGIGCTAEQNRPGDYVGGGWCGI